MPKLRVPVDMPKNEVTAAVDMPKRRAAMVNLYIAFFFACRRVISSFGLPNFQENRVPNHWLIKTQDHRPIDALRVGTSFGWRIVCFIDGTILHVDPKPYLPGLKILHFLVFEVKRYNIVTFCLHVFHCARVMIWVVLNFYKSKTR